MVDQTPNFYADAVQIGVSPFGVVLQCGMKPPNAGSNVMPTPVANVRMSLEHAKVLAIMLRKNIRQYEQALGTEIPLPSQLWSQLGLSRKEDW